MRLGQVLLPLILKAVRPLAGVGASHTPHTSEASAYTLCLEINKTHQIAAAPSTLAHTAVRCPALFYHKIKAVPSTPLHSAVRSPDPSDHQVEAASNVHPNAALSLARFYHKIGAAPSSPLYTAVRALCPILPPSSHYCPLPCPILPQNRGCSKRTPQRCRGQTRTAPRCSSGQRGTTSGTLGTVGTPTGT